MKLLVTGATGFLGQQVVSHALAAGNDVVAIVRPRRNLADVCWASNDRVKIVESDLALASSVDSIVVALSEVDVVIHAAGVMFGDDTAHRLQTVGSTRFLIQAMTQSGVRELVLISSLSVYGYSTLPDGAQLDELTPTEHSLNERDAYSRAKLAQEAIVQNAAQKDGFGVRCLRLGAIYGPNRLWSARIGIKLGSIALILGGSAKIPVTYLEHSANAVLLAAARRNGLSDVYAMPDPSGRVGSFEIINVVDDDQPTQSEYADLLKESSSAFPNISFRIPWSLLRWMTKAVGALHFVAPRLVVRLPVLLRPASMCARFKPLRYSNCRLYDRLGWRPMLNAQEALHSSCDSDGR